MALRFRDQLTFKAAFGGATVDLDILLSLTDSNTATNTCVADDAAGTAVGITLLATGHTGTVTYDLTNSDGGAFSVNSSTGVVSVGLIAPTVGTRSITGMATSSSGQTVSATFSITVTSPVPATIFSPDFGSAPLYAFTGQFTEYDNVTVTKTQLPTGGPSSQAALRCSMIQKLNAYTPTEDNWGWYKTGIPAPSQGDVRYLRWRMKLNSPIGYYGQDDVSYWGGKFMILGTGGAGDSNRCIINLRANVGPIYTQAIFRIEKNVDGGARRIDTASLPVDTWFNVQLKIESSSDLSTADGRIYYYQNNNVEGSPTLQTSGTFIWDCSTWTTVSLGYYTGWLGDTAGAGAEWEIADLELADSFDSGWHS